MNDQIAAWGLRDAGFDYNLVAVFGSQSTGKSMFSLNVSKLAQQLTQQVRSLIGCSAPTSTSWMSRSANRRRRVSGSFSVPSLILRRSKVGLVGPVDARKSKQSLILLFMPF